MSHSLPPDPLRTGYLTTERLPMDKWFYYDVTHDLHTFYNPIDAERVDELGRLLPLDSTTRVLDMACGHGELLIRWCEQHGIRGVGVDLSPYFIARAERRRAARVPGADLTFLEQPGAEYRPDAPFDVAACIGASWIWGGHEGTLRALVGFVEPGGIIVAGEPYWIEDPPQAYLEAEAMQRDGFHDLAGCLETARGMGLELLWMMGSSHAEWDRYELLQALAVDRFRQEQPKHPDLDAIAERKAREHQIYCRWGRRYLGFAIWAFRVR